MEALTAEEKTVYMATIYQQLTAANKAVLDGLATISKVSKETNGGKEWE